MSFDGQKRVPHFEIPLEMLRNTDFMIWLRSAEASVYLCLYSYIVRSEDVSTRIGKLLYSKYYRKRILASSWNQKMMARKIGLSDNSTGYVSRLLTSMENKGIIKKHKDKLNRRSINVYEFGTHTGEPYKHETLYVFNHFIKASGEKTIADFLGGNPPISWGEIGI